MTAYLKRLVSSLAAYQVADVVSKFIAVLLLPVYTRYINPAGYGVVELLGNGVILISILVRFGMIESFLRFYYSDADPTRRDALARRATGFLLLTTTIVSIVLAVFAAPLSKIVLGYRDPAIFRIAVLGLWAFTNLEMAYALLRVDERLRAYATATLINVGITIAASVVLVVVLGQGAKGLLLGNYGASTIVLLGVWWTMRDRLAPRRHPGVETHGVLFRFGLPTVPAEASVYALSIVDRYYIFHHGVTGPRQAGLYSIAVKLAGAVAFIVRAFQYAWPPLAYSVRDDAEAARLYGLVTTYYLLVSGLVVAGLALLGRWVLRLLAAPSFYDAYKALPWVALGWALYGLWVVFLVIAGRAKVTTRNFPAALAGLIVNVVMIVLLVPAVRDRRRRRRAVRGVRGDDRGHALPHPPGVRGVVRVASPRPAHAGARRPVGRRRSAAADARAGRAREPGRGARGDAAGAARDRIRPRGGDRAGPGAARAGQARDCP